MSKKVVARIREADLFQAVKVLVDGEPGDLVVNYLETAGDKADFTVFTGEGEDTRFQRFFGVGLGRLAKDAGFLLRGERQS